MIPATTRRLILNPAPLVAEVIRERSDEKLSRYVAAPLEVFEQRLKELDREWNVERLTAALSGLLLLLGLELVSLKGEQWLVFPAIVAACLLLHAVVGWTPALPLLRGLGFRTPQEIARERYALETARGVAQTANLATAVQDREALSRFENEGGGRINASGTNSCGLVAGGDTISCRSPN